MVFITFTPQLLHMKLTYFFFVLVLLISCKASKDQSKNEPAAVSANDTVAAQDTVATQVVNPNAPLENQIIGTWQWEKTICCGRTPHTETAESLPAPKILKFQTTGTLQYFSGDSKISDQTYKIAYELLKGDGRPTITIGARQPALLFIEGDNMTIDYGYIDLQQEFYTRVK